MKTKSISNNFLYISGQLPIGLITFKQNDSSNVRMRCNIKDVLPVVQVTRTGVDKNYWTFWRDTYPHAVYLILKIASKEKSTTNRKRVENGCKRWTYKSESNNDKNVERQKIERNLT